MATYYVGSGGNNASAGTSWGARWLTVAKAMSTATAGDTVYYAPGNYYEAFGAPTNSGSVGNVITHIGDYTGANTDGVGGTVRVSANASNNQTRGSGNWSTWSGKSYHTVRGFTFDGGGSGGALFYLTGTCTNITFEKCYFEAPRSGWGFYIDGTGQANITIQRCYIRVPNSGTGILFFPASQISNVGHLIDRCIIECGHSTAGISNTKTGGVTVRNTAILGAVTGIGVTSALAGGQVMTVNNCLLYGCSTGLAATTTAEFSEDYNRLANNGTNRSNVTAGSNSNTYQYVPDTRWFHAAINGSTVVSPYDLASVDPVVELNSGTGASSTDLRGTSVKGSFLEWGPLEYNSALVTTAGGGVTMWPLSNSFIGAILGGDM